MNRTSDSLPPEIFRLPNGKFPHYVHSIFGNLKMGTVHGDQYIPPWVMHPRFTGYFIDDFGNSTVILDESLRQRLSGHYDV